MRARERLFGVEIDPLTMDELVESCCALIDRGGVWHQTSINAGKAVMMQQDSELMDAVRTSDVVTADGQSIVWAGRLLGVPIPERVPGIDLMERLLGAAESRSYGVYFLGASEGVLARFVSTVSSRYPRLTIAGASDGYYDDPARAARAVAESGAQLLFIAMPSPRKELFTRDQAHLWSDLLTVGVGGSFDVWAGVTTRAPKWMQRVGLEWFFRLVQEPRRMWRRYLVGNARFAMLVLRELRVRLKGPGKGDAE